MAAVTDEQLIEAHLPSIEVVRVTASDGNTYVSKKFAKVTGAILCLNEDADAYVNVVNSDGTTIDGTTSTVKLNIAGGTSQTCTLLLFGYL